jgi:hypothetical protein
LLLFLAGSIALAAEPTPARGSRYALLIGVTKYPYLGLAKNEKGRYDLSGPSNDVECFRKVLTGRFGFPDDAQHVRILTEEAGKKDAKWLPDRANIEREFRRLAAPGLLQPGDQVVILMSGHGSQQPADWTVPGNFEPDGLDELFMARDVRDFNDRTERYPNAITDDQLREWVDAIVKTRALVWITLDSCHSGTMLRPVGKEKFRQIPADQFIPRAVLQKARDEGSKRAANEKARGEENWPDAPQVAAIYAAKPEEVTLEMEMPGATGGQVRGLLSWHICEVLSRPSTAKMSYTDLVREVQARYSAMHRSFPTPTAEGHLCDRGVLTFEKMLPRPPPITLTRADDRLNINAGRLQGLSPGCVLAVYSAGQEKKGDPAGYIRIKECDDTTALVEPVKPVVGGRPSERRSFTDTDKLLIPERNYCELAVGAPNEFDPPVAVALRTAAKEALPPALREPLLKELRGLAESPDAPIRLVDQPDNAWLIQMDSVSSGRFFLLPPDRAIYTEGKLAGKPVRYGPIPEGPERSSWLHERFARISRAVNLLRCVAALPEVKDPDEENETMKVELQVVPARKRAGQEPSPPLGTKPVFLDGEDMIVRVINKGRDEVFFNLLVVTADHQIKCIWPKKAGDDNRLLPSQPYPRHLKVKVDREGIDHFIVIAVKSGKEIREANFSYLEQPSLERARDVLAEQGKRSPGALNHFLMTMVFSGGRDYEEPVKNCSMQMVDCWTKPRPSSPQHR